MMFSSSRESIQTFNHKSKGEKSNQSSPCADGGRTDSGGSCLAFLSTASSHRPMRSKSGVLGSSPFLRLFWSIVQHCCRMDFVALLQKLCFMTFMCQSCAVSTCQEETDSLPSDIQIRDAVGVSHSFAVAPNLSRTGMESQVTNRTSLTTLLNGISRSFSSRLEKTLCSVGYKFQGGIQEAISCLCGKIDCQLPKLPTLAKL